MKYAPPVTNGSAGLTPSDLSSNPENKEALRQSQIAKMREQQRLRRKQMAGQIDMNQQSDIMKKFEDNML